MDLDISPALHTSGTQVDFDVTGMWQAIRFAGEEITFPQSIRFHGNVLYTGEESLVSIEGVLSVLVERPCYRCLAPAGQVFEIGLSETFSRVEEEERFLYTGEILELDEMLQQDLLLRLPMRALCSTDCRGLCPQCGKPQGQGECTCGDEPQNPYTEFSKWLQENKEV